MITPSFNLTATERVLPKLALDFTTAALDSRVTFTRTTDATHPATYVNSSGYIAASTNNSPRFDYDPVTLACKGLLIEESRTNSATYSEAVGSWSVSYRTGVSISTDAVAAPDNQTTADIITLSGGAVTHAVGQAFSLTNTTTYTVSFFVKPVSWNYVKIGRSVGSALPAPGTWWWDLSDGSFHGSLGAGWSNATCTQQANGFWRCSVTVAANATNTDGPSIQATDNAGGTSPNSNGSDLAIWGLQWETGAFATSYIPTTSAALTRNADVATMTGTNFSDWFNAAEGTLEVQGLFKGTANTNPTIAEISDGTTANNMILDWYANSLRGLMVAASSTKVISSGSLSTTGGTYKGALGYKTNNFGFSGLGATFTPNTTAAVPAGQTQLNIGCRPTSPALYWNSHVQKINYWPQRLTNAELQAFSK